jgi:Sulfotransferase family.
MFKDGAQEALGASGCAQHDEIKSAVPSKLDGKKLQLQLKHPEIPQYLVVDLSLDYVHDEQEQVFFHHMVGTGGNTLAGTLARSGAGYDLRQLTMQKGYRSGDASPLEAKGRVLFYGHNLFGLPEEEGMAVKYVTMLRHPYERLISDHFWRRRHENRLDRLHGFYRLVEESEHLEFYIHHCGDLNYRNRAHFHLDECSQVPNKKAFALAMQNLVSKFLVVGIMEMFEESLFLVAHRIGLRCVAPWWQFRHPKSKIRPSYFDLPRRIREGIAEKCKHDVVLYETWRECLENKIKESDFAESLFAYCENAQAV